MTQLSTKPDPPEISDFPIRQPGSAPSLNPSVKPETGVRAGVITSYLFVAQLKSVNLCLKIDRVLKHHSKE